MFKNFVLHTPKHRKLLPNLIIATKYLSKKHFILKFSSIIMRCILLTILFIHETNYSFIVEYSHNLWTITTIWPPSLIQNYYTIKFLKIYGFSENNLKTSINFKIVGICVSRVRKRFNIFLSDGYCVRKRFRYSSLKGFV